MTVQRHSHDLFQYSTAPTVHLRPAESTTSGALRYLLRFDPCSGPPLPKPAHGPRPDGPAVDVAWSRCARQLPPRPGPRPTVPVGPAAGSTEQRCTEQLLPGSVQWPAVPHRGLRSRRRRVECTKSCIAVDGLVLSLGLSGLPSRPTVVPNKSRTRSSYKGRQKVSQHDESVWT